MPTNRREFLAGILGLGAVVAGCSSGGGNSGTVIIKDTEMVPVIATSEQVVGPNRFVIGLLDKNNTPIVDAKVHLKFFELVNNTATPRFESDTASVVPARDSGITEQIVHIHTDGSQHVHVNAGDDVGVYSTTVTFDKAGNWGVEINVDSQKPKLKGTQRISFNVIEKGITPAIGSPAPKTRNATLADATDITKIDSSSSPMPELHRTTIADAIAAGKPALVLFAVPGYCDSRFCGPEYEIMKKLYGSYEGKAAMIHVEFYKDPGSPQRVPVDAVREWNLQTEPWFFVIDARGIISAKFEGPTTLKELDDALKKVV